MSTQNLTDSEILRIAKELNKAKREQKSAKLAEAKASKAKALSADVSSNPPVIKLMDCCDFLNDFEDNSIDLLITDPPYSTDVDDIKAFAESWLPLALRKLSNKGRGYICIGAYPKELETYLALLLAQDKFILDNPLIWTYRNTLGVTPKNRYNLNYQIVLHIYGKDSPALDTSITNEMFSVQDINAPDGRQGDRYHTWQKPLELGLRLVRHSSQPGQLAVDCFACTGTFLLAAAKHGMNAVGCELNPDNLAIAKARGCV